MYPLAYTPLGTSPKYRSSACGGRQKAQSLNGLPSAARERLRTLRSKSVASAREAPPAKHHHAWSAEEDARLMDARSTRDVRVIADEFGRTFAAASFRLRHLKRPPPA